MHIEQLHALPVAVQYLIFHGLLNPRDTEKVEAAVSDALHYQLKPEDLWRISTSQEAS